MSQRAFVRGAMLAVLLVVLVALGVVYFFLPRNDKKEKDGKTSSTNDSSNGGTSGSASTSGSGDSSSSGSDSSSSSTSGTGGSTTSSEGGTDNNTGAVQTSVSQNPDNDRAPIRRDIGTMTKLADRLKQNHGRKPGYTDPSDDDNSNGKTFNDIYRDGGASGPCVTVKKGRTPMGTETIQPNSSRIVCSRRSNRSLPSSCTGHVLPPSGSVLTTCLTSGIHV